jgi:hypothetical protein
LVHSTVSPNAFGRILNEVLTMSGPVKLPDAARKGAQKYFTATEQHETLARREIEKARTTNAAKIAKLRALRLAKEALDRDAADKLAIQQNDALAKAPAKRNTRRKPAPEG